MIPFQISFLDFPESDAVWMAVQKRIEKLEHFYDRIVRCDVAISCPHHHRHADRLYHIRIHVVIPGDDVIVSRDPSKNEAHRNIYVAIRDAFNAAERVLEDKVRVLRGKIKAHQDPYIEGKVAKLFYDEKYGFLESKDGREIYFGENSVVNGEFDHLHVGQRVRFVEERGEKGPQASSMSVI